MTTESALLAVIIVVHKKRVINGRVTVVDKRLMLIMAYDVMVNMASDGYYG